MRIVCPRCVAQYEVDESAIPEEGREVQCANCENIWFQDYIEMLPTTDEGEGNEDREGEGVFDDLDGKSEVNFYSSRGAGIVDQDASATADFEGDDASDLLGEDFDDDLDDDEPSPNITVPPVDPEVIDVLRSEAAFSSVRDQIDVSTQDDNAGENLDTDADVDPADDELAAFLEEHSEDVAEDVPAEPIEEETDAEPAQDPDFDPLSDLDAIRSQLDTIGESEQTEEASEYTPVLPVDGPSISEAESEISETESEDEIDDTDTEVGEQTTDLSETDLNQDEFGEDFDTAALAAALDGNIPEVDEEDFDDEAPRHAYRADGGSAQEVVEDETEVVAEEETIEDTALEDSIAESLNEDDTPSEKDDDGIGLAKAAAVGAAGAAAVGLTRPKTKGTRARARSMPGFETSTPQPEQSTPDPSLSDAISDALDDSIDAHVQDADHPALDDVEQNVDTSRRPKADRKALLPDVEELDASLRSEGEEPRRRDREMMEAHEQELAQTNKGGFRKAFVWTLFIFALLIALYIFRPQIVEVLPAAAVVLDPYASIVLQIRAMIDGLIG